MTTVRQRRGAVGEELAARFLSDKGFEILHRNLRLARLEIDLVCRDGDCLVFVEVKRALSGKCGHPAEWIGPRKQDRLREAARRYLEAYDCSGFDVRFDAVAIIDRKVEHYPNAF